MKQFIALFLAVLLLLSIVSCADVNPPIPQETEPLTVDSTASSEGSEEESKTIAGETNAFPVETAPTPTIFEAPPAEKFDVLEVGIYDTDYTEGSKHTLDVILDANQKYYDEKSAPTTTITYLGKTYELPYQNSEKRYQYGSDSDIYQYLENGVMVKVRIDRQTGFVKQFQYADKAYLENTDLENVFTDDECYEKVMEYFSTFTDTSDYELTYQRVEPAVEFGGAYTFYFTRIINGVKTSNQAVFTITFYGDIVSYHFFSPEPLDPSKLPAEDKLEEVNQKIYAHLDEIYAEVTEKVKITSYEIRDMSFERLFDGRYALVYTVRVHMDYIESGFSNYETSKFLIYLD